MTGRRIAVLALVLLTACEDGATEADAGRGDAGIPMVPSPEAEVAHAIRVSACLARPVSAQPRPTPTLGADVLERRRCTVTAGSCEEVLACLGIATDDACAADSFTCDGTEVVQCVTTTLGPRELRTDCAGSANPMCAEAVGRAQCVRGTACGAPSVTCEGADVLICGIAGEPLEILSPCAAGLTCIDGNCVLSADPCPADSCDGDVAVHCSGTDTVAYREDCAAIGATCEVSDGLSRCALTDPECEVGSARCEGTVAEVCGNDGRWQSFDCAGFDARCESTDAQARCVR